MRHQVRRQVFVLLTSVIRAHLAELFPGRQVEMFSQFRVTRDSDLEVDEDDVTNLRQALRSGLTTRHFGQALRLEVVSTCPPELSDFLLQQFALPAIEDARGSFARVTVAGRAQLDAARRTHLSGIRERFLDRLTEAELDVLGDCWARVLPPGCAEAGPACGSES